MWTQNVVPGTATPAFPFSTTMHPLPPVPEGQTRTANRKLVQNRDQSCQKVTTNWWQKGAKGHQAKEGGTAGGWTGALEHPASCRQVFSLRLSSHLGTRRRTTWQSPTIRYLQTTICPKSICVRARVAPLNYPLSQPPSSLSSPTTDHFLIPPELFTG